MHVLERELEEIKAKCVEKYLLRRCGQPPIMDAQSQYRTSTAPAREVCHLTKNARRVSPLQPSPLPPIPEDLDYPGDVDYAGGCDAAALNQTCVERISLEAATDAQQRSIAGPLLSAGCVCTPCCYSDQQTYEDRIVK